MRRGYRLNYVLAALLVSTGSNGVLAQDARKAPPAQAPKAQQAPAGDPDRMKRLLKAWEQESSKLKSLDVSIERLDRSKAWGEEMFEGRAILMSPNLAWLNFDKVELDPNTKKPVIDPKTRKTVKNPYERIVCTGTEVWQYRSDTKQIFIFPLDRQQQKRALEEGPLPFLFNMKAAEAEARYEMNLVDETSEYFVITIIPRLKIDAESFAKAFLKLSKKTFLPDRIFLLSPNGKDSKDFSLTAVNRNKEVSPENFKGKPMGPPWTMVRDPGDRQVAPAAAAPGIGARPVQPAGNVGPAPRRR